MKILWLDTETTGLDCNKNDIVQISGIVIINGKEQERFNLYSRPTNFDNISQEALEKNNMTIEKLKQLPEPNETFNKFKSVLAKYVNQYDINDKFYLAGQNVKFDLDFLKKFFLKNNDNFFGSWFYYYTIDLMSLAIILHTAGLITFKNFKLETIAKELDIECDKNLHDASVDIDLARKCFCRLFAKFIKF